jgi:hypothetical protein
MDDSKNVGRPMASALTLTAGFVAGLLRVVPHPPNFSPVGALGLFGGARLRSWYAFALPIAVMVVTDCLLWAVTGFDASYSPFHISRPFVYASFLGYVLIGRTLVHTSSLGRISLASVLGSLQFYLITNFGTWATTELYPHDLQGLLTCFVAGLPFYESSTPLTPHGFLFLGDIRYSAVYLLLGDLLFSVSLFGLHAWLARRAFPAEAVRPVPVPR